MKRCAACLLFVLILTSCLKNDVLVPNYPILTTGPVATANASGATFSATISNLQDTKITRVGFLWGDTMELKLSNSNHLEVNLETPTSFSAEVHATFVPGTIYWVRAYLSTADFDVYGNAQSVVVH